MIIFNLDGTLADCEHRKHLINPESYPALYEYSNYYISSGGKAIIDNNGKASWRCKKTGKPFEIGWRAFYDACDKDKPIYPPIQILKKLRKSYEVEIWSGRCESVRQKTIDWLFKVEPYIGWPDKNLLKMRPINCSLPEYQLKERWLDEVIAKDNTIDFVFDFDPASIKMWKRRGVFVFNCCQHDEEF